MLPLEGINVVALEQAVAAPFATRHLADLGARVIKIERPRVGDFARAYDTTVRGMSSHFVWVNRSKESLTLDVKQSAAKEVLHRLLDKADVFVQNLAPGACDRLGLGTTELRERYPRLIVCNLSGYGATGPYRDRRAYDMLVQSEAGLVSLTGTEETPSKVGISISDIAAGMYAFSGILTALLVRKQTGKGTALDISLLESIGEWMGYAAYYTAYGGTQPPRAGASHAAIAPYGPFISSDGKQVLLAVQNEREWARFCEKVIAQPELENDPRFVSNSKRVEHRPAVDSIVAAALKKLTAEKIIALLEDAQIAYARLNSVREFVDHPQLAARERWREVDSPVGPLRALVPPGMMEGAEPYMGAVPALGQHTDAILTELGFDANTIAAWRQKKMI
ncbi:MAG TPA: CaiB/BaiF CoA-transferase family protein [Verrucomicrobiae bacterium]|jgi:itaconate CoA-transferase|nr:CaiB/BaiF CoA-transferase family protein [Verrucomicrobiae bacterium]